MLINFHGKHVLTDPVFGESIGLHFPFGLSFGPRQLVHCALMPEELPLLDLVVQSHAHMDHLDTRSWRQQRPSQAVVMAARNERYIRRFGFSPVTELRWGGSAEVAGLVAIARVISEQQEEAAETSETEKKSKPRMHMDAPRWRVARTPLPSRLVT